MNWQVYNCSRHESQSCEPLCCILSYTFTDFWVAKFSFSYAFFYFNSSFRALILSSDSFWIWRIISSADSCSSGSPYTIDCYCYTYCCFASSCLLCLDSTKWWKPGGYQISSSLPISSWTALPLASS